MSSLLGMFVGGASRRMGGRPKGLLLSKDTAEPLVVGLARAGREAGLTPVWVGSADAYRALVPGLSELVDEPTGIGPLGGLCALLKAARGMPVVAVACDMPYVTSALLRRLATEHPAAPVLAPRSEEGFWEPLCARYHPTQALPACEAAVARGEHSLQSLLGKLEVRELALSSKEKRALLDWDSPEDLAR